MPAKVARLDDQRRASRLRTTAGEQNSRAGDDRGRDRKVEPDRLAGRPGSDRAARSAARVSQEIAGAEQDDELAERHSSGADHRRSVAALASDVPAVGDAVGECLSRIRSSSSRRSRCSPPPCSRKNATTGKAKKNRPALRPLAGRRGISSGNSSTAASRKVRLTRQRSCLRIEAVDELVELGLDDRASRRRPHVRHSRQGRRCGRCRSRPHRPAGI